MLSKHICTLCYVSFGPNETCKNSLTFFNFLLVELNISDSQSRISISRSEDIVAKLSFVFVNNDLTLEWCQRDCKTQQKKISNQQQNWEQQLAFANFSRSSKKIWCFLSGLAWNRWPITRASPSTPVGSWRRMSRWLSKNLNRWENIAKKLAKLWTFSRY